MMRTNPWWPALAMLALCAHAAQAAESDSAGGGEVALPLVIPRVDTTLEAPDFAPMPAEPEPTSWSGIIEAHNLWRRQVGAGMIEGWSSSAAALAQVWADKLQAEGCQMRHNLAPERRKFYGENIYRYWRNSEYLGYRRNPQYIVDAWGSEIAWFDPQENSCNPPEGGTCGHYTQLVWSDSKLVGCGRAHCGTSEIWVCNYYPRGNYYGMRPFTPVYARAPATGAPPATPSAVATAPAAASPAQAPTPVVASEVAASPAAAADAAVASEPASIPEPAPASIAAAAAAGPAPDATANASIASEPASMTESASPGVAAAAAAASPAPAEAAAPVDSPPAPASAPPAEPEPAAPAAEVQTLDYFGEPPAQQPESGDSAAGTPQ